MADIHSLPKENEKKCLFKNRLHYVFLFSDSWIAPSLSHLLSSGSFRNPPLKNISHSMCFIFVHISFTRNCKNMNVCLFMPWKWQDIFSLVEINVARLINCILKLLKFSCWFHCMRPFKIMKFCRARFYYFLNVQTTKNNLVFLDFFTIFNWTFFNGGRVCLDKLKNCCHSIKISYIEVKTWMSMCDST